MLENLQERLIMNANRRTIIFGVLMLALSSAPAADVTIKRDTWGVPHIFAETLADGAYGLGYAEAEDRLNQIFDNYRGAIGRAAEVKGSGSVEQERELR